MNLTQNNPNLLPALGQDIHPIFHTLAPELDTGRLPLPHITILIIVIKPLVVLMMSIVIVLVPSVTTTTTLSGRVLTTLLVMPIPVLCVRMMLLVAMLVLIDLGIIDILLLALLLLDRGIAILVARLRVVSGQLLGSIVNDRGEGEENLRDGTRS